MNDTAEVDRALRTARSFAEEAIAANIQWRLDPRYIKTLCDEIDRLRVAAPASAEPVGVKALEWQPTSAPLHFAAQSVDGQYYEVWTEKAFSRWCAPHMVHGEKVATLAEAKAAAQEDYEQRIRSALASPEVTP